MLPRLPSEWIAPEMINEEAEGSLAEEFHRLTALAIAQDAGINAS